MVQNVFEMVSRQNSTGGPIVSATEAGQRLDHPQKAAFAAAMLVTVEDEWRRFM